MLACNCMFEEACWGSPTSPWLNQNACCLGSPCTRIACISGHSTSHRAQQGPRDAPEHPDWSSGPQSNRDKQAASSISKHCLTMMRSNVGYDSREKKPF